MRYQFVRIVLATAMIAGVLLSPRLWLTERHYPHAPVWDGLPAVPPPWDRVIFGGMILLLAVAAVTRALAAFSVVLLVISIWHWFLIPTICIGVMAFGFVLAAVTGARGQVEARHQASSST